MKPEAPGPVYVSESDHAILNLYFEALDRKRWEQANAYRPQISDPVARTVADWAWYRAEPDNLDWRALGRFLDENPDWPNDYTIQRFAEEAMTGNDAPSDIIAFFRSKQPVSGYGKIALARALLKDGQADEGKRWLRDAWVNHNWPVSDERNIASEFATHLSEADHYAKVDRQLFDIIATDSRRLLDYLSASHRQMAEARIALLRRDGNAVRLLEGLSSEQLRDSGVLHAAARYYRRGENEPTAIGYAAQAPINSEYLRYPEAWWGEKNLLMLWAMRNGLYKDAYRMAAYSGLSEGGDFAEAEFYAGWIALRFLKEPERARRHFAYLDANVSSPISKARAQYWLGRAFAAEGNRERARQYYAVAAAYPLTFYGQLAQENLGTENAPAFPGPVQPTEQDREMFNSRPLVHAMRILSEVDEEYRYIAFARQLDDVMTSPGEYALYEELVAREDMLFLSVRAGKAAVNRGAEAPSVAYPRIFVPGQAANFVEEPLILGLSRQESEFNPRAYSSANARGLMQLLPSTAQLTARKEGFPYSTSRLMDDPLYNLVIGSAHLSHLIERFEGSYVLTLVGYNAGPNRASQWIERYGDPRNPDVDPVDWVELIPFDETRNYVQRVLENTQIYRSQVTGGPIAGKLSQDLVRGGGTTTAIGLSQPSPILSAKANQWEGRAMTDDQMANLAVPAAYSQEMPDPVALLASFDQPLVGNRSKISNEIEPCEADAETLNRLALSDDDESVESAC
ncbi:lytic transglycosylase domain-containing protein [Parvularcula flava]|uniref:Lytic transglycosylase n=1 Tax=Aquisalinus luteolus TaxID=1566827 RepID=A0A8J3A736_9PROT|nr:lytic transglycosylase domain-containing protein [Aquisalinus luteolus]NHK27550.1 lytic transglycosylase domain-containing protein [Aquisalinus luteolus]GGH95775.1 lytic transglycosylase [Aquisalinus luteolus]